VVHQAFGYCVGFHEEKSIPKEDGPLSLTYFLIYSKIVRYSHMPKKDENKKEDEAIEKTEPSKSVSEKSASEYQKPEVQSSGTTIIGLTPLTDENENEKTTEEGQEADLQNDLQQDKNPSSENDDPTPAESKETSPNEEISDTLTGEEYTENDSRKKPSPGKTIKLEIEKNDGFTDTESEQQETEETIRNIFENSIHENEKARIEAKIPKKNDTRLNRLLQILTSIIVGTMLMSATVFFERRNIENDWETVPNYVLSEEETQITLLSDETFTVSLRQALFGGESIRTNKGLSEIRFFDGSSLRMQEGAEIIIEQIKPYPIIRHKQGDVWVLSQQFLVMEYENARFYTRESSAEFLRQGNKITASAFRHPLFGEIWSTGAAQKTLMTVPTKKKIVFSQNTLPPTLSGLHFSKLKKELQLQSAEDSDWVRQNVAADRRLQNKRYDTFSNTKRVKLREEGLLTNLFDYLTLFPSREKRNTQDEIQNRETAFYDEYVFGENSYGLATNDSTDSVLNSALYYSSLARPDVRIMKNMGLLIGEMLKRKDIPHQKIIIAQTLLSLLEDTLYLRDPELASKAMTEIVSVWKKQGESEENKRMLEIYRESIANLMRKNMDQVTSEFFVSATELDELALEWEKEERIVIALEVVERNIETAESFLRKMQFDKAEEVIKINNLLLQIQPTAKLITAYRDIKQKQDILDAKHQIFSERKEVLSDASFHAILSEKEAAKKTIETIKKTQDIFADLNQSDEEEVVEEVQLPLPEQIREDFSEQGLVIISMLGAEEEDASVVEILEGRMSDGSSFSAEYLPYLKVIKNMKLPEEELIIPGDILLRDINIAVRTIRSEKNGETAYSLEKVTEELQENWKETGEDPLKGVDPLIIEVSRRLLMGELQKYGFYAQLTDIEMIGKDLLRVDSAVPENIGGSESISLVFNKKTQRLSEVKVNSTGIQINAQKLDDLEEKMIQAITEYAEKQEKVENLLFVFTSAGANTEESSFTIKNNTVDFFGIVYEEWIISGTADLNDEVVLMLQRNGLPLDTDVPFEALKNTLQEKWKIFTGK
jgi:hypothetical protein